MAKKNRKKNKKIKKEAETPRESLCQEAQEELLALEAIYVDEFKIDDNGMGFSIKVLPHPGDAEANFVSVTLQVKCTRKYPEEPPDISIVNKEGLSENQSMELLDLLVDSAVDFVNMREVYMFSLVILCQESLQVWNERARKEADQGASLWDAMQQRHVEEASFRYESSWDFHGSLFADDGEGGITENDFGDSTSLAYRMEETGNRVAQAKGDIQSSTPKKHSHKRSASLVPSASFSQLSPSRRPGDGIHGSIGEFAIAETTSSMSQNLMSLVHAVVEKVVPLPSAFLKFLGLANPQDLGGESVEDDELADADKVRRDLLTGYLLKLVTSGTIHRMPVHSLHVLSAHLHSKKILPKWVQWILAQRPALFNRAFSKLFAEEIHEADSCSGKEPQPNDVLKQFWTPKFLHGEDNAERSLNSRYFTDFDEVKRLGRGGFGVVVSATNRLDGRQYAIKKIKILHSAASYYSRMMREVATLSRLQHPNVVRYFQAWFEPWYDDGSSDGEEGDELDAWQGAGLTGRSSSSNLRSLETVVEGSETGTSSLFRTPSLGFRQGGNLGNNEDSVFDFASRSRGTVDMPSTTFGQSSKAVPTRMAHQTLYIQMELCSRNLQQVLEEGGTVDEEQRWEVVRQILLGLGYIHSQRIIHRDLKPANIFYSASGEIKLGDFGLAKFTAPTGEVHPEEGQAVAPAPSNVTHSEATGMCGTALYIAPEVANNWASYDFKVDMYSLGVVVFELWYQFATGMERSVLLKNLQEKQAFPDGWAEQHPKVAELIGWLMSANPLDRPTPREVLQSQYLPPRVGDDQIRDLMRSIHTDAETYDRVVDGVFTSAISRQRDIDVAAPDLSGAPILRMDIHIDAQERVTKTIKQVFSCHGAVQMSSSEVGLGHTQLPDDAVRVLSSSGDVYALKYDLRCPFAEWLIYQASSNDASLHDSGIARTIEGFRRYDISTVYRQGRGVTLTKTYLQTDLDFVTPPAPHPSSKMLKENKAEVHKILSEQLLAEAEVVKAVSEVVNSLKMGEPDHTFEVKLSHTTLMLASLRQIGLPHDKQQQFMKLMSMAARVSARHTSRADKWKPIQESLEGLGLSSSVVRHCKRYCTELSGDPDVVLPSLRSLLLSEGQITSNPMVAWCLEELDILTSFLRTWNVHQNQVVIEPLMKPEADYFSGVFFQIHILQRSSGRCYLVGIGGRYDKLLAQLWKARGQSGGGACNFGGVGATLNLDPFLQAETEASACLAEGTAPDVLVCSRRGGTSSLEARMNLVSKLWSAGVKADMLHKVAANMTLHYEHAVSKGIRWLVTIDEQKLSSSETVRVKNLDRRIEEDVPFDEVPQYIQNKMDVSTQRLSLSRQTGRSQS